MRSPAVKALLRHQAVRARDYYARAAHALPRRDARRLVAAEIMAAIYRGVLDRIEQRDYDVFSRDRPHPAAPARGHRGVHLIRILLVPGAARARVLDSMTPDVVVVGAGFAA